MFRGYEDENGKRVMDEEYLGHAVFESLNGISDFYHNLADSIMHFAPMWVKNSSIINYDSYFLGALANTIESIRSVLELGHITDAKAMLRNFFDEAIVNLYFMARLKRKGVEISSRIAADNFVSEFKLEDLYDVSTSDWLSDNKTKRLQGELYYDRMLKFLENEASINEIVSYLNSPECKKMREWLNDAVHLNYYNTILLNDGLLCVDRARKSAVDEFNRAVTKIVMLHITCMFCMQPVYMMSSDYCDYLDIGKEPPEGCQYAVAPFIQSYLDKTVYKLCPQWAAKLVATTSPMRLRILDSHEPHFSQRG